MWAYWHWIHRGLLLLLFVLLLSWFLFLLFFADIVTRQILWPQCPVCVCIFIHTYMTSLCYIPNVIYNTYTDEFLYALAACHTSVLWTIHSLSANCLYDKLKNDYLLPFTVLESFCFCFYSWQLLNLGSRHGDVQCHLFTYINIAKNRSNKTSQNLCMPHLFNFWSVLVYYINFLSITWAILKKCVKLMNIYVNK